jgi:hypothetical protein
MNYLKLFENFEDIDLKITELDDWIESHRDHISFDTLKDKLKDLFQFKDYEITQTEVFKPDSGGDDYGENWGKYLVAFRYKDQDLMLIYLSSDMSYDFGKNATEFEGQPKNKTVNAPYGGGVRFFFDRTIL